MNRTDRLGMRVTTKDKKRWKEAAAKSKMPLSAWIEVNLNRLAEDALGAPQSDRIDGQLEFDTEGRNDAN